MPKYTPVSFELNLRPEGVLFDVGSLMHTLTQLQDRRDARGVRYALVTVLVFVLFAKLCGADGLRAIAQWVYERPFFAHLPCAVQGRTGLSKLGSGSELSDEHLRGHLNIPSG